MIRIIKTEEKPFHILRYQSSGPKGNIRKVLLPFFRAYAEGLPKDISSIVATSDLQGREIHHRSARLVGEAVAEELVLLQEQKEIPTIDTLLMAGDFYDYPDCRKLGGTGDVTQVWNAFASISQHVIGVHGNHDIVDASQLAPNVTVLDGNTKSIRGIQTGGICGIIGRPDKNQRKTDIDFQSSLNKVIAKKPDILLLHQGPDDPQNQQVGDSMIREIFEMKGQSLVIFGHCHWRTPRIDIGKNQLLNVDNRLYVILPG